MRRWGASWGEGVRRRHSMGSPQSKRHGVRTHQIGQSLVAGLLILLALPVLAACAAAIALDSGRPILFRCRRTGRNGVEFDMLKFRKMPSDAAGPPLTAARDERFTRVGRRL